MGHEGTAPLIYFCICYYIKIIINKLICQGHPPHGAGYSF
ncbi:hypothetical protein B8V81_0712 [Paenibacillus pasadenensis]|uniref:Uncharacterized protein n=1 Tax=Paenibacillus pasadenensis TaxID=217090 RepID=A0A2N5NBU5_9BACL|nr:hypothetical protein B8V81_0712 [Paenibacillus pasadenensis]